MGNFPDPVQNFTRSSGTATSTPAKIPANVKYFRTAVKLSNTGLTNTIYVYLTPQTDSAPTISASAWDYAIAPGAVLTIPLGSAIGVWVATLSSTSTYEVLEMDGDPAASSASVASGSGGSFPTSIQVEGIVAEGATGVGSYRPALTGGYAWSADRTAVTTGQVVGATFTLEGKQLIQKNQLPVYEWKYAAASGGITNNTEVSIKAAVSGRKNLIRGIQVSASNNVATEVTITDGSAGTVIWRMEFNGDPATYPPRGISIVFDTPLKSSVNTALYVKCVTTGAKIYFNAQGGEEI